MLTASICFTQLNTVFGQQAVSDGNTITYNGNKFEKAVGVDDTVYVDDPVTGETSMVLTRREGPIVKMNDKGILTDYYHFDKQRPIEVVQIVNKVKAEVSSNIINEVNNIQQSEGATFSYYIHNLVVDETGKVVYYELAGTKYIRSSKDGSQYEIATTRPELLPACVAVFYHPEDARFTHLEGKRLSTPYFDKVVTCLPDTMVDPEKGTGLVMCCTFGDQTDIMWYQKHNLPLVTIIDEAGKWNELAGPLKGLRVHEARKKILELLNESGKLIEQKHIEHHVNVHERCKQPIEFRVMHQWFVNILDHKEQFLKRGDELEWTPEFMQSRYNDWVQNLGWDWCISRQRFYGVPFPVWHCSECNCHLTPPAESLPIDPQETTFPGGQCTQCGSSNITPDTDVMDTWNISSLTPLIHSTNELTNGKITLPMSLRPQAHDIIRTWAFYTVVKSQYHHNTLPWNKIAISGHVMSGNGKISKSQGGAKLTPENLLEEYGADAVRYWTAKGKLGVDTAFSQDQIKQGGRLVTKLWNAFRFISEHVSESPNIVAVSDTLNQWLLQQVDETITQYKESFSELDHTAALEKIDTFFWSALCDNYLELIKDRLFNKDNYPAELINETLYTLHHVGIRVLQLYAPFVPFVTEQLYQQLFASSYAEQSIHNTIIELTGATHSSNVNGAVQTLLHLVSEVRKQKSEAQCSLKTPIRVLTIHLHDERLQEVVSSFESTIKGISKAEQIEYSYDSLDHATHLYDSETLEINVGTVEH